MVNNRIYNITLTDVLHIPNNQQNLLSLGRWDKAGGSYHGEQGKLRMNTKHGETVVTGVDLFIYYRYSCGIISCYISHMLRCNTDYLCHMT